MYDIIYSIYIYICVYIYILFIYLFIDYIYSNWISHETNRSWPLAGGHPYMAQQFVQCSFLDHIPIKTWQKLLQGVPDSPDISDIKFHQVWQQTKNGRKMEPCLRKRENLDGSWWLQVPKCSCMLNSHTSSSARSPSACDASISTANTKHLQRLRVEVCWGYTLAWNLSLWNEDFSIKIPQHSIFRIKHLSDTYYSLWNEDFSIKIWKTTSSFTHQTCWYAQMWVLSLLWHLQIFEKLTKMRPFSM